MSQEPTEDAQVEVTSPTADDKATGLAVLQQLITRSRGRLGGIQYNGNRDIYSVAGYPAQGQVKFEHYWGMYTRGDIAGRIVDMPAKTTWRTPPEIVEEGMSEDGTEFTKAFTQLAKRLKLWSYMSRLDRLSGIGNYAVMMIGVRGTDDLALKQPLSKVSKPEDIIYLSVYHQANATIEKWVTDSGDERFGLPELYKLRTTSDGTDFNRARASVADLVVHASRVIHAAENVLEDDVFGRPRLERSLNRLFDLDKVAASTAEAYWQQVTQILQAKIDKEAELTPAELTELEDKMGEMVHDLRRQFLGRGVELGWLNTTTPNVQQVGDFFFSLIAGSAGIPKRILFGSEMGELASSTDQENYMGLVNERQEDFAEPQILRAFIDKMIAIGALPTPAKNKGEYKVMWPDLFESTDKDKADTTLKRAQAASALTPVGGNPRELVRVTPEGDVELVEREPDEPPPEPDPNLVPDPNHLDPNAPPEAQPNVERPNNPAPSGGPPTSGQPSAAPAQASGGRGT